MHPIVEQTKPSPEQRPAIIDRGRDVVVTAGAGTGKTRTLVARYLSLLAEGLPLRSIVAITFTKKAAREMRNRVRDEMRRYLSQPALDMGAKGRWQGLYSELDAARIGTIHSLCTEILRAHPAEARVDPRFEVLDEGYTSILRGQALDETMAWAADNPAVVQLFVVLGEYRLRLMLDELIQQRLGVRDAFSNVPTDLLPHWEQALRARQEVCLGALLATDDWANAVATLRANIASNPDDRVALQRQDALGALRDRSGLLADDLASLSRLDRIDLRGDSQKNWPGGKDQLTEIKTALRTLRDLWRAQKELLGLALTAQDELLARMMPTLSAAFDFACQRYDMLKQERNALDFDDLESGALALLQRNVSARQRWQQGVGAILVDEFQDTNGRQRDLVALLNDARGKLFIVGDAKQSIYRFRGADVTVFRRERDDVGKRGGARFSLDTSYRAHRELIEGLNALLRPVLGLDQDPGRPWVEPFAPIQHHRERAGPGFAAPHIEMHLTVGSKGDGALNRAADALAARVVKLVKSDTQVMEKDRLRALDYGDVAILCRASGSFPAYEDALERAGVPFLTVAGRGFYDRPEIRDLLNALQALADPTDDLALVGLLRSPAFALSDAALTLLCEERTRREVVTPLWNVLPNMDLPAGERDSAERAICIIGDLNRHVGRIQVGDLLKAFLDVTAYRAALLQAGQGRGARNVSKLLADANASGIVGVGEFLEYVASLRDTGAREGEARATAEGAVQIMSVHAAKGLEFPVVVIGDATRQGRGRNSALVDPHLGVLLPLKDDDDTLPAAYRLGKGRSDDQEAAESDRLFYVAATRAREKLILSGCIRLRKGGIVGQQRGWLGRIVGDDGVGLAAMAIDYNEDGNRCLHLDLESDGVPVSCVIYEPTFTWDTRAPTPRRDEVLPGPLPPPMLAPLSPGEEVVDQRTAEAERTPPQRVWRVVPRVKRPRAPAWVIGSLVHRALAAWRFPDAGFQRWAEARVREYGVTDPQELGDAVTQCRRLLSRFREHALYREMDAADRRLHEVPYSLSVDGRVESGIIDALYLQGKTWTIVEFKTDEVRTRPAFDQLLAKEDYLKQAQRYIFAAERLLDQRPRFYLCMLNYIATVKLHQM